MREVKNMIQSFMTELTDNDKARLDKKNKEHSGLDTAQHTVPIWMRKNWKKTSSKQNYLGPQERRVKSKREKWIFWKHREGLPFFSIFKVT